MYKIDRIYIYLYKIKDKLMSLESLKDYNFQPKLFLHYEKFVDEFLYFRRN